MGFDAIPEDREQAFPCEVCNGSIKLSAISGLWECDECGCLPGSKLVAGHTKEEHEEAAGMSLDDMFMAQHHQPCDCAVCDDIDRRESLCSKKIYVTKEFLFSLMHSHSKLSQSEYDRNPAYNNSHFSAMAETALVNDLPPKLVNEYFDYVDSKEKGQP